jgi:hypothetical protein
MCTFRKVEKPATAGRRRRGLHLTKRFHPKIVSFIVKATYLQTAQYIVEKHHVGIRSGQAGRKSERRGGRPFPALKTFISAPLFFTADFDRLFFTVYRDSARGGGLVS